MAVVWLAAAFFATLAHAADLASPQAAAESPLAWPPITTTARPWVYWWWMGSAVNDADVSRELERYHQAGLGGAHIIPIYGAKGYEAQYIDYLSPAWMAAMSHAVTEARKRGMDIDMTTGSGWCFGGPNVPEAEASIKTATKATELGAGKHFNQKLDPQTLIAVFALSKSGSTIDLTAKVEDGRIDWAADGGGATMYVVTRRVSKQVVKRPAPGGEGFMLNPFYGDSMAHYLNRFSKAFDGYEGAKPRAMYHDSYEYVCDWSPDLLEEFASRRGYDLKPHLPRLFGPTAAGGADAARLKCDYRETLSDLMVEHFAPTWVKWSHGHGFDTRYQAHGSPGNLLDLYALADMPETEMFQKDRDPLVTKFASSAAHVAGRPLVCSETGTWLAEHFTETLGEMKGLVDEFFASGINHIFYHGCCYSPDDAAWPGWCFYASTEMNPRNSIWHDASSLNAYASRCQSILQAGRPDNDILLYWPIHDFWQSPDGLVRQLTVHANEWLGDQPIGRAAKELWEHGYTFDYVSGRQLGVATAKEGDIVLPGGGYRAIVVPRAEYVPVAVMEKVVSLAEGGATILFEGRLPADVPGLGDLAARRTAFHKVADRIRLNGKESDAVRTARVGSGRVLVGDLRQLLVAADLPREALADHPGLLFTRRAHEQGRHYFVANHGDKAVDGWVTLATPAESVAIMSPMTGVVGVARVKQVTRGRPQVYLQLRPGESLLLRTFTDRKIEGPAWRYEEADGRPTEITGTWLITPVTGGPQLPGAVMASKLKSWTEFSDVEYKRFAGSVVYSIHFDAPPTGDAAGRWSINLGAVCQSARTRLNEKDVGTVFAAPFRVLVDGLKEKDNVLELEVTNVSANRIADMDRRGEKWKYFRDINVVGLDYKPLDASGWPAHDSGLLGPVTLRPVGEMKPD